MVENNQKAHLEANSHRSPVEDSKLNKSNFSLPPEVQGLFKCNNSSDDEPKRKRSPMKKQINNGSEISSIMRSNKSMRKNKSKMSAVKEDNSSLKMENERLKKAMN